ncbi:Signal transduction histidine kinase [Paenibacillus sp. UNCCL117]|uniref:ATP-binding protein n=1 Tax=unclassified Paenibacillus TaxID=185978 RepID=UPI0008884E46|nr:MULTISPECIES: ATP-binding protein [unclassified Paenibacillus]SDE06231.1 Signal transduction histidine kinase [Paenibacillus sp. cl123]SFW59479.1 Signal transduction histidine kinase [Paenibacillus sp. UNCCL117]
MMTKKLAAAAVTFILLAATYGLLFQAFRSIPTNMPAASQGLMDLADWNFARDGNVTLDGEWEFYPGVLLGPEDFQAGYGSDDSPAMTRTLLQVPGSWTEHMDTFGVVTYRLQIRVAETGKTYGLKTSSIQMANRIFMNGLEIGASGEAAEEPAYQAGNKPYVSYFPLRPGWNEMIVQAANFDFQVSSGMINSIAFGYSEQISSLRDQAFAHDLISSCSFLIMGLYFIGLYTQRTGDRSLLVFGLLCICIPLFQSTRGEKLLLVLFDYVPYWLYIRIQTISVFTAGMMLLLYVYTGFRPFSSKRIVYTGIAIGLALTVWAAGFIDLPYNKTLQHLTTAYATLPFLYATYVFVLAAFHRVEGSLYLVIAAIALNYHSMLQSTNVYANVPLHSFVPIEVIIFLLMLALLMSHRFSNAFKKIEQLSVQLLKADQLKDDFLSRTSHEFKTPLHSVITISQSMLDDKHNPLPVAQQEKLGLVLAVSKRLAQLVLDILDLSKLKQGDLIVQPIPVDVRSTVDLALRIFSFSTADKNVRLINLVPEDLPHVYADENRLRQILNNLLDNAIKYTKYGSIEVAATYEGGKIEVSVQDTGTGIDEQELEHIFEPFRTYDLAGGQSFGLGLPIVKQLLELQHGDISVSSVKGEGTVFTFRLPSAEAPVNTKRVNKTEVHPDNESEPDYSFPTPLYLNHAGDHTILIVDDQFSNLKIVIDALAPLAYNIIAVKNGFEAAELISRPNSVDLVVLDLMMPGMSGYEVCQTIRRTYTLLEMPVLMVTTAFQPQDKLAAFEAGANDFLPKPFDTMELKARIKGLLLMKDALGKAVDMEVAFLQSQIKPHFLYNVLNTIVSLSYTNISKSRKLTTDLAHYLRGSFQFSNVQKRTTFGQELKFIESYVEIETVRFKERLRVEYDIAQSMYGAVIPPLLIQPLVENAIRHGVGGRIEGGTVTITAKEADGYYWIQIEDDGIGIEHDRLKQLLADDTEASPGVGLRNIGKRLKYEYHTELQIDSVAGEGTRITVRIPSGFQEVAPSLE